MKKIYHWGKRHIIISAILVIIVALVVIVITRSAKTTPPATATVVRSDVVQKVSVTGKTKAVTSIDMAFEKSGRIVNAPVAVGDHVKNGQVLVELDRSELFAQQAQAQASVDAQQAKLDELERGPRSEDIQIKQTAVSQAQQLLSNEYQSISDVLNSAYVKADDAVRKQVDDIFTNDEGTNPQLTFTVTDNQKEIDAESGRQLSSLELSAWKNELATLPAQTSGNETQLDAAIQKAKNHLVVIRSFLDKTMDALVVAANLPATTVATYKTAVTTARTNVSAAIASVTTQEQTISTQKLALAQAKDNLNLTMAGSTPQAIAAQAAQVKQARANLQLINAQLNKNVLRSPIDGIITKQGAKVGELAPMNTPLVSIIAQSNMEIEANVPEADVAKLHIGDATDITFDAFGESQKFSGKVESIDPAATVIEGVPTYKTTFALDQNNPAIKPGLTANLDITTARHQGVLNVPQRTIGYDGDQKYIMVYHPDSKTERRNITTDLRGSEGEVEVTQGLREGERVLQSPD